MHTIEDPFGRQNLEYVEMMWESYQEDPSSVDAHWQDYFSRHPLDTIAPIDRDFEPTGTDEHFSADLPVIHRAGEVLKQPSGDESPRDFLRKVPIFQSVPDADMDMLVSITQDVRMNAGEFLGRTGNTDNDLYMIRSGRIAIMRGAEELTELGPGELVGELAVFDMRPRSADIRAKSSVSLYRICRKALQELLSKNNNLTLGLLKSLSVRLRDASNKQERVDALVRAYRERGHVKAKLDPLGVDLGDNHPELDLSYYGFQERDLEMKFTVNIGKTKSGRSLGDINRTLNRIYCKAIGLQYMHIDDIKIQRWLRTEFEHLDGRYELSRDDQFRVLTKLTDAEVFENFLHRTFIGAKRFSLEGTETLIPLMDYAIEEAGRHGVDEVIIGMAHRGRLNTMVNILDKPAAQVFREFMDKDAESQKGRGDVKYHLGYGCDRVTDAGHKVHISLCFNPSHLEFVGPVVLGRARAKQDRYGDKERFRALPVIIHGDAAIAGQGVVQEMLNFSELPGYRTGGAVHIVLNNQIGFTTDPSDSRSTQYCTDVARMLQIPIFHVNGEQPEAVCAVIRLAMEFRARFQKDVVIDMYGYRKYGHNEGDEPEFTQPLLYKRHVRQRRTVREGFVANLLPLGEITQEDADRIVLQSKERLERDLATAKEPNYSFKPASVGQGLWAPYLGGPDRGVPEVDTHLDRNQLVELIETLSDLPAGFTPHPKIARLIQDQHAMARGEKPLTWAMAEALAFASLLRQGMPIRLAGQDVERGTFTHRHAVLHDYENGTKHVPLAKLGRLEMYNSPLTETAVLGFEYGYSLDTPDGLTIWEAQFGDFCNVAQVIIDQFISSSEEKWSRLSGLCMLLPHGMEGQGPEHSSARLERWLMLSAADNMRVVNLTTPAQLFHCLRRHMLRNMRKPLVVMSPKSLLRHPLVVSDLSELSEGRFHKVLADHLDCDRSQTKRVLLTSGKLYYELLDRREKLGVKDIAIVRMEQYYPLPLEELRETLSHYPKGTPVVWVQEEPLNMGAWSFLKLHLTDRLKEMGHELSRITRDEAASPATGSAGSHKIEQENVISAAFAG